MYTHALSFTTEELAMAIVTIGVQVLKHLLNKWSLLSSLAGTQKALDP